MATIVAKKLGSKTERLVFEVTNHADEIATIAGRADWSWRDWSWRVWIHGPEKAIETNYEIVFAATMNNQHDRLNFRDDLNLTDTQKAQNSFDKLLRKLFGIPRTLEFVRAQILISPIPRYRRVVLTVKRMHWKSVRRTK